MTEPLSPAEQAEMKRHLAFLKKHKSALRLSLNATEDLMVNGVREPTDRGACKHLIAKIDRTTVEQALSREPFKSSLGPRAELLAGVVRLHPDIDSLLWYLETVSQLAERREAARAFHLTVDRIDFSLLSTAQVVRLLEVVAKTFSGHELTQALLGLLDSTSFRAALGGAIDSLGDDLKQNVRALAAAHRAVIAQAGLPEDAAEGALVERGLNAWLNAPDDILRSYPKNRRIDLLRFALYLDSRDLPERAPRALFESLPHDDPIYAELGMAWAERLLREEEDERAKAILGQLGEAQSYNTEVRQRLRALSWKRVGRVTLAPTDEGHAPFGPGRLQRAFWLDRGTFVWARTAPPEGAGQLVSEGKLQASLNLPGVVPSLEQNLGRDGMAYLVIKSGGRPLSKAVEDLSLANALFVAHEGLTVLNALAVSGIELPDVVLDRFVMVRGAPKLVDLCGAVAREPASAGIAHGLLAAEWCRQILSAPDARPRGSKLRTDLPVGVVRRLSGRAPLAVLARELALALALAE